ncbi:hypothetical protein IAT40_007025 [Kwoniella sp. CBS 6097]
MLYSNMPTDGNFGFGLGLDLGLGWANSGANMPTPATPRLRGQQQLPNADEMLSTSDQRQQQQPIHPIASSSQAFFTPQRPEYPGVSASQAPSTPRRPTYAIDQRPFTVQQQHQTIYYSTLPPPPAPMVSNDNGGPRFEYIPALGAQGQIIRVPVLSPPQQPVMQPTCASPEVLFGRKTVEEYKLHTPPERTSALLENRDDSPTPSPRSSSPSPETGISSPLPTAVPMAMKRSQSQNQPVGSLTSTAPLIRPAIPHLASSSSGFSQAGTPSPMPGMGASFNTNGNPLPTPETTPTKWIQGGKELTSPPKSTKGKGKQLPDVGEDGEEPQKRRRIAQACDHCRHRKARCSGGSPCARCTKDGYEECKYTPIPRDHEAHPHKKAKQSEPIFTNDPATKGPRLTRAPVRQKQTKKHQQQQEHHRHQQQRHHNHQQQQQQHQQHQLFTPSTNAQASSILTSQNPFVADGGLNSGLGHGLDGGVGLGISVPTLVSSDFGFGLQLDLGPPAAQYPLPMPQSSITFPGQLSSPIMAEQNSLDMPMTSVAVPEQPSTSSIPAEQEPSSLDMAMFSFTLPEQASSPTSDPVIDGLIIM